MERGGFNSEGTKINDRNGLKGEEIRVNGRISKKNNNKTEEEREENSPPRELETAKKVDKKSEKTPASETKKDAEAEPSNGANAEGQSKIKEDRRGRNNGRRPLLLD